MKLTKLLPIATIGCVASIVTPLATSCGDGMYHFDGKHLMIPKTPIAIWDRKNFPNGYTRADALNLYLTDVKNNPNIFIEDMCLSISSAMVGRRAEDEGYQFDFDSKLDVKFENVVADPDNSTLSLKATGSGRLVVFGVTMAEIKSFSFDVKKAPFTTNPWDDFGWQFYVDENKMATDPDMTINVTIDGYYIYDGCAAYYENESFSVNKDRLFNSLTYVNQFTIEQMFFTFANPGHCFHLQNLPLYFE